MMHYLLILLIGYLLGCSNMAVYLAAAQNVDLRSGGSGNPGAFFPPFRSRALYRAPPASSGTCSRSICAFTGERALPPISA